MKVCIVGSGAREHALAEALARTAEVVVAPGNPGVETLPGVSVTPAPPEEVVADLFVVGPEAPLVDGLADRLRALGRKVLGPGAEGARLEGSKAYMKRLVEAAGVPTARWASFDRLDEARAFLRRLPGPYVVKTDGLAAGKGVLVTPDLGEAEADLEAKLSGAAFGEAGRRVVVEEGLAGEELSVFALCDGKQLALLPEARDHKRLLEGDLGPNTGGMGAFSPVPGLGPSVLEGVVEKVLEPTVEQLRRDGVEYRGILYAGLMLTAEGPRLIEYNVRLGDPEAEVVLLRCGGDLAGLFLSAAEGHLAAEPSVLEGSAVCVVAAAPGYPESPATGSVIEGVAEAALVPGVHLYHSGTRRDSDGRLRTSGGRVLVVGATGADLVEARSRAYDSVGRLRFPGMQFRSDIGRVGEPEHAGRAEPGG